MIRTIKERTHLSLAGDDVGAVAVRHFFRFMLAAITDDHFKLGVADRAEYFRNSRLRKLLLAGRIRLHFVDFGGLALSWGWQRIGDG